MTQEIAIGGIFVALHHLIDLLRNQLMQAVSDVVFVAPLLNAITQSKANLQSLFRLSGQENPSIRTQIQVGKFHTQWSLSIKIEPEWSGTLCHGTMELKNICKSLILLHFRLFFLWRVHPLVNNPG